MNVNARLLPLALASLGLVLQIGCGSDESHTKADPAALEAVFQSSEPAPAAEAPAEESTTDTLTLPAGGTGEVPVKEVAGRAAAAMRKDDVAEAIVALQTLRRARNLSPDQLTAVQDQMAALQSDLANRAASGDQRAKQALQLMQQSTRW